MDVLAILLPIEKEYRGFRPYLSDLTERQVGERIYEIGTLKSHPTCKVILRRTGSKNVNIALETQLILEHFQPFLIILSGIAAGIKDVTIGDIVVGTKAYGYESGKVIANGTRVARPDVVAYDHLLIEKLRSYERTISTASHPAVVFGPIVSGENVVTATDSEPYRFIKDHYNDSTALEMESIGFATACQPYRATRFLNIRGISDLIDGKTHTDGGGGQELAVRNVARFVFGFLEGLDFDNVKIELMNSKTLIKKVANTLFAENNLAALLNGFSNNDSEPAKSIYHAVEPLITEELQLIQSDPQDEDDTLERVRVKFKDKLKAQVGTDSVVLQRLEAIMNQKMLASKNTITNSTFTAGGDINVGDRTTTIGQQVNNYGEVGKQVNIKEHTGNVNL